jgi:hypothetical protein
MGMNKTEGAYERKFLELLLRHELPDDCEVRITVTPKGGQAAEAVFSFDGDMAKVKTNVATLGVRRLINKNVSGGPTCW